MNEKRILYLILILFILLGIIYAVVTPVFEASDELWHYPMVRHLADGNPLPVQVFDPDLAGPWNQEASQPPLYYYLGAALTFWIDSSDMEQVRWLNPHVDSGLITADGNINLAVHDPDANQWQGTLLAVHIVRIFSVLLGAATVYLTYCIAKELAPERPEIALGATAVNAFMPMFLFISGSVNNDNLAVPLASLAVLLMIRSIVYHSWRSNTWVGIGIVIGLAVLTKEGTLALLPLAGGTIFMAQWQRFESKRRTSDEDDAGSVTFADLFRLIGHSLIQFVGLLAPVLLIAGWWYYRNVQLYGDWLGWSAFIAVLGQRAQPASLAQLWGERWGFLLSYWGLFGGVNVPMWTWIYRLLNGVLLVSLAGFGVYVIKEGRREIANWRRWEGNWLRRLFLLVERRFGLVVCLLFAGAVVYGLIRWATTTWSSQGRLVFTAVSALSALMVVGLAGWLPRRPAGWIVTGLGVFMFIIAALAPWVWIRPAYQPAAYEPLRIYVPTPVKIAFGDKLQLRGFAMEPQVLGTSTARPGEAVDVMLEWEVLRPMTRDWSLFVHLSDPVLGVPIAQRDMYPGQGLRPTSLLQEGERLMTYYRLFVPETAVSPANLELWVGWYDFDSGQRLSLPDGRNAALLAKLWLESVPGPYPNPVSVNFGDEMELVGYELAPRRTRPGEMVELVTYWRAIRPLITDYTFFAQVVGEDTTRWASNDLGPAAGTAVWPAGEVQTVRMPLTLQTDTPAAVYPIHLGLYTRTEDGGFARLQIVVEDGRITQDDFLLLTQVRVD